MKKKNVSSFPLFLFLNISVQCTVIGARIYFSGLVFDPRVNLDEFGDEARYVTLDNCGVPPKDVFVHHVHCIPLPDNCNQTPVSGFTISRTSTYTLVSVIRSIVRCDRRFENSCDATRRSFSKPIYHPRTLPRILSDYEADSIRSIDFFPPTPRIIARIEERTAHGNDEGANFLANLFLLPCLRSIPYDCPSAT